MAYHMVDLPSITFSSGATASPAVGGPIGKLTEFEAITLFNSSGSTTALTVQVEQSDTGAAWKDLQSAGADITMTASEAITVSPVAFRQLRLLSTGAVNANVTVGVAGQIRV